LQKFNKEASEESHTNAEVYDRKHGKKESREEVRNIEGTIRDIPGGPSRGQGNILGEVKRGPQVGGGSLTFWGRPKAETSRRNPEHRGEKFRKKEIYVGS